MHINYSVHVGSNAMSYQLEELTKELPGHLVIMKEQLRLLDAIGQGICKQNTISHVNFVVIVTALLLSQPILYQGSLAWFTEQCLQRDSLDLRPNQLLQ